MYRPGFIFPAPRKRITDDQPKNLSEAVKVNKLRNSELRVYFKGIRTSPSTRQEFIRQSQHYEEFKKAYQNKRGKEKVVMEEKLGEEFFDSGNMKEFLKRYELRKKDDEDKSRSFVKKPAMRRTPLRTIKTVNIELPGLYSKQAILSAPKQKSLIAKSVDKASCEEYDEDRPQKAIEKQLEQTQQEISLASTQLEQIREILYERKLPLASVTEESEEISRKPSVKTVDKKCSAMPRVEWNVKAISSSSKDKNRLMTTLTNLNQRLQKIQEKYFNQPRVKYKSIDDFRETNGNSVETIYRNFNYVPSVCAELAKDEKLSIFAEEVKTLPVVPNSYGCEQVSSDPTDYLKTFMRKAENSETLKKYWSTENADNTTTTTNDVPSVDVLFSPKFRSFEKSRRPLALDAAAVMKSESLETSKGESKSILKKESKFCDNDHYALEAPDLQESIFKSNYLMKEFNINPKDLDFDLSKILLKNDSKNKKNVRFIQSNQHGRGEKSNRECKMPKKLFMPAMDVALKNSFFYTSK